jgi:hypothetical protein
VKVFPLSIVTGRATPKGSEALPFGPKNHSKFGVGILDGRGVGSTSVAEHVSE